MSKHSPLIKVHVHEHTGTLTLNRPDKRNALTRAMLAELLQALDDLRCERRVRSHRDLRRGKRILCRYGFA